MFLRVRKVKKKSGKEYEYGYLVNSKWRKRAKKKGMKKWPEHKYVKQVGRVYRYKPEYTKEFEEFLGEDFEGFTEKNEVNKIYKSLIKYQLLNCGFTENNNVYANGEIIVDLNRLMVHSNGKEAIVRINEKRGYICSHYLEELFKFSKINGREEGMELMKKIKQLGLQVDAEKFYILAKKLIDVKDLEE